MPASGHGGRRVELAYLTTQYPSLSHTFIRREIRALEAGGRQIERFSIRPPGEPLVEPADRDEAARTTACLAQPARHLFACAARLLLRRPRAFLDALGCTLGMARHSERGHLRHLAYLVEACFLHREFERRRVGHVHVHFGTNAAAVARLVRRLGGPSFSISLHGPDEFDAPLGLDLCGKAAEAAFVRVISDFTMAQIRRWARRSDWPKIHVVRCAPAQEFFADAKPVDERSRTVVAIGRLAPQKGLFDLLEALALARRTAQDLRLVLVGDGPLRPELEARARELGPAAVEFAGAADEAGVRRHMLAARAVVLASYAEGLPMVVMEAFALGRPVIATGIAGVPELVIDGQNGWLVPPGRPDRLAEALGRLLATPASDLTRMGEAGRRRTLEMHDQATECAKLERLFRDLQSVEVAPRQLRACSPAPSTPISDRPPP